MSWRRFTPAALAVLLLLAIVTPGQTAAHAVLLRSVPSSSQTLALAPTQVQLLFSEPIDAVFSALHVVNASGQPVDNGDGHVDQTDDRQLVVTLQSGLPNGIYTVRWRSLSTIDVHPDEGQYPLFVGVPVSGVFSQTTASAQTTATPETTFGRWWFYLAASLFGGVLATWKLVLGSGVFLDGQEAARATVRRRAQQFILLGGILLVLGTLFTAVAQAAAAANVPLLEGVGRPLADLLLRGRFATIWWPRLGLELASLLLIAFGGLDGMAAECALATLPAVLLTSALTSHGAALPDAAGPGIAIDWLHIVGATAWVGGLFSLLLVLPLFRSTTGEALVPRLVGRFGRLALIASAIVVLSGALQATLEIGSWSGLLASIYGQLVVLKIGLLAVMLALATLNELRGRQAARQAGQMGQLRRGVRVELAVGVVVLAVAAVLSGTPPTRGAGPTATASQFAATR